LGVNPFKVLFHKSGNPIDIASIKLLISDFSESYNKVVKIIVANSITLNRDTFRFNVATLMPRAREIVRLLIEGKNYTEISGELGLDRKTVYNVRNSLEFSQFFDDMLDVQLRELDDLMKSGVGYLRARPLRNAASCYVLFFPGASSRRVSAYP